MPNVAVQLYACMQNHRVCAFDDSGNEMDLTGYFCPLCMGAVKGNETMIDSRILAPVQGAPGK